MYRRGVSKSRHKGPENRAFWHYACWPHNRFRVIAIHKGNRIAARFSKEEIRLHTV
jgi:hypothetical protein